MIPVFKKGPIIVCDKLTEWADKWQMKIAFNECTVHRISNRDSYINQNPGGGVLAVPCTADLDISRLHKL